MNGDIGAGDTLGRYELLLPLAQGGTAAVWVARIRDLDFEQLVAIKMMLGEAADPGESQSLLLDEARTVSRIHHPHIVEVFDVAEKDELSYLVMEFVDGEQLNVITREALKSGGVPLPIALRIAQQICSGLHAAHEIQDAEGKPLGIVHRDVSPQNILVGFDGAVRVIDFGVAKATSNLHRTSVGQLKGKAGFMAPEQARGQPVDRRTDIFALGVVIYQLLSGKHPFHGENEFAIMRAILDATPAPPIRNVMPSCPAEIEAVIAKALAKVRDQRHESMRAFEEALAAAPVVPAGEDEVASYVARLVGARGEKRRVAIRHAVKDANARAPGARQDVDAALVARASTRPIIDDADTEDGAIPDFSGDHAWRAPNFDAPPSSGDPASGPAEVEDPIEIPHLRPRRGPILGLVAVVALLAIAWVVLAEGGLDKPTEAAASASAAPTVAVVPSTSAASTASAAPSATAAPSASAP